MTPQVKLQNLSTFDQIKLEGKIRGKLEVCINSVDAGMDVDFIVKVTE